MQYRPTGDLGAIMKKGISAELMHLDDHQEEEFRARYGIGAAFLKPRLDTFISASTSSINGQTTVHPGFQTYEKFNIGYGFIGADYIKETENRFKVYPGADVTVGYYAFDYSLKNSFKTETGNASYWYSGLRLRGGVLYELNDFIYIHLEVNRSYNLLLESFRVWSNNDIGLTFQFVF